MDLQTYRDKAAARTLKSSIIPMEELVDAIRDQFEVVRKMYDKRGYLCVLFTVRFGAKEYKLWLKWMLEEQYDAYMAYNDNTLRKITADHEEVAAFPIVFYPKGATEEEVKAYFKDRTIVTKSNGSPQV